MFLVGKPDEGDKLARPGRRWEDNIKMCLKEIFWLEVAWIDLAQDRDKWRAVLETLINLPVFLDYLQHS